MHSLAFNVRYRPLRIGWCLRANNIEALRRTLRQNYTLWGGNRNPLIVVDDNGPATDIVESANVDVLLSVLDNDPQVKAFIERFPHLSRVGLHYESDLFRDFQRGRETPLFLDVVTSARQRARVAAADAHIEQMQHHDFDWDDADPIGDICLMSYGSLPREGEPGATMRAQIDALHAVTRTTLQNAAPLPRDSFRWKGVRYLTGRGLERDLWSRSEESFFGFFLGSVSNYFDLVNYWNLRASGHSAVFLDPTHFERMRDLCDGWKSWLVLNAPPSKAPVDHIRIWTRVDGPAIDMTWIAHPTFVERGGTSTHSPARIPLEYLSDQDVLANVGKSRNNLTASIPLPKPPFEMEKYQSRFLAITLRAGFAGLEDESLTFQTPYCRKLNRFYGEKYFWQWYGARVEPRGLALLSEFFSESISVGAMRVTDLFEEFFRQNGINAEPSNAGLVTSRVIAQMGGVDSCRPFRVHGLRSLIEGTRPDSSFTRPGAIQKIREQQPDGTIGFDRYKDLYIEPRKHGAPLKPDDVFRYMVDHGAFRVGLEFKCIECALVFWVSLDNARSTLECEYCGSKFDVTSQLKDRDWRYRRSGVFGKDDSQEGAIPVALTLLRLRHMGILSSFLFVPAHNLTGAAHINSCETDFAAMFMDRHGRAEKISFAIGECKTRKEITEDDVTNLVRVADIFEDHGIDTFLIFSKLEEFSTVERQRISHANRRRLIRAIVFSEKELEPWFPYKWAEKPGAKTFHGNGLEDFAEATDALYLRDLPAA